MCVDFSLSLLDFLNRVLGFKLSGPSFLVHNVYSLLFSANLAIDVFQLTAEPLRHLVLLSKSLLQFLVLNHQLRGVSSQVCDLRVKLTFQVVQLDILMLLLFIPLLKFDSPPVKCLVFHA